MEFREVTRGVYLEGLIADVDCVWVADPIKGGIRRVGTDGSVRDYLPEKRWVGSLLLTAPEKLLISGEGGIIWLDGETGESGPFLDTADGETLPGVNEMTIDWRGGICFGSNDIAGIAAGRTPEPAFLMRLSAGAREATVITRGLAFSNGLAVSRDERWLFHNETFVGTSAYPILPSGALGEAAWRHDKYDCDGMAMDADGNIWVTGFETSAIIRLTPDGEPLADIALPAPATNVRFGGADKRDIYVTCVAEGAAEQLKAGIWPTEENSILYHARSDIAGIDAPYANLPIGDFAA